MSIDTVDKQQKLFDLIRDVKPSLKDHPISLEDSLVENLGLDSLDIMQLARKIRRVFGNGFDPQQWVAKNREHRYLVGSILEQNV